MVADIEELENRDASEVRARRLDAKEVIAPKKGEHQIADGTAQLSGRDQESEIPLTGGMAHDQTHVISTASAPPHHTHHTHTTHTRHHTPDTRQTRHHKPDTTHQIPYTTHHNTTTQQHTNTPTRQHTHTQHTQHTQHTTHNTHHTHHKKLRQVAPFCAGDFFAAPL